MSLHAVAIPQFQRMLDNLSRWLDKANASADAGGYEVDNLLTARLAPDQFNLTRNVQAACDTAKLAAARMAQLNAPVHEDGPATLEQLQDRLRSVNDFVAQVEPQAFDASRDRGLTLMRGTRMQGQDYVLQFALPNFYFHCSMVYAILRHNGMPLGKLDYLGPINASFAKD